MGIGKRIKEARELRGYTQKDLGDLVGVTASAVTNYENETSHPKEPILYALLNALDVDANFLFQDCINRSVNEDVATPQEMKYLVKKYRVLDNHGKKMVDLVISEESERMRTEESRLSKQQIDNLVRLNLYDSPVSAGAGEPLEAEYCIMIEVPINDVTRHADFALRVSGDSMEPLYYDDDIILIKRGEVGLGNIGVFIVDGNGYVKKLGKESLISLNNKYADIPLSEECRAIGKVLGKVEK